MESSAINTRYMQLPLLVETYVKDENSQELQIDICDSRYAVIFKINNTRKAIY